MSNFRLNQLSNIPFRLAIGQMGLKELIALTLTFDRLKPFIKGLHLKSVGCLIRITPDDEIVVFVYDKDGIVMFGIDDIPMSSSIRKVNGVDMRVEFDGGHFMFMKGKNRRENHIMFRHVLKHLMDFITFDRISITVTGHEMTSNQVKFLFEESVPELEICGTYLIGGDEQQKFKLNTECTVYTESRIYQLDFNSIQSEELRFLKEDTEHLRMQDLVNILEAYTNGQVPYLKNLYIETPEEIHRPELFNILEKWENVTISAERDRAFVRGQTETTATISMDGIFHLSVSEST